MPGLGRSNVRLWHFLYFVWIVFSTVTAVFVEPADLNPEGTSHPKKPSNYKSRRDQSKFSGERRSSAPSQQHGRPHHDFQHGAYQDTHRQQDQEGGSRRGRGRRDGFRGGRRGQRAFTGDQSNHGPEGTNWWRDNDDGGGSRNLEPGKLRHENPRRRDDTHLREKNSDVGRRMPDDDAAEEQGRSWWAMATGPDPCGDHRKKQLEQKRRQGPIKPSKVPARADRDSDRAACRHDNRTNRQPGDRHRGQRSVRNRNMPQSNQTQTGYPNVLHLAHQHAILSLNCVFIF